MTSTLDEKAYRAPQVLLFLVPTLLAMFFFISVCCHDAACSVSHWMAVFVSYVSRMSEGGGEVPELGLVEHRHRTAAGGGAPRSSWP